MKPMKRILVILLCIVGVLFAFFMLGRYGWKLGGFRACEGAGIEQVDVEENQVHIRGFYPGSFPQGFLGCYAEQVDDTLYVGFKFSGLFGIFEPADFDITIPAQGTVARVVIKSGEDEHTVWPRGGKPSMSRKALVVIDLQNDITKNYRDIIDPVNKAVDWAVGNEMDIAYIRHYNLSAGTRIFKDGTHGAEFVPELNVVTDNIFSY